MTELTPEAAALLEAARQNHGPTENDRRRVLSTLHASLGIGVPVALSTAASQGLSAGQTAAQSGVAQGSLQGAAQGAGSLGSAGSLPGAGALVTQGAAQGTGKAGLGWAAKLLTWKAGKLMLASVALSSAVGIGLSAAPRAFRSEQIELSGKAGQAGTLAAVTVDAGATTSPTPAPDSDRGPTVIAERASEPARARPSSIELAPSVAPAVAPAVAMVDLGAAAASPPPPRAERETARSRRRGAAAPRTRVSSRTVARQAAVSPPRELASGPVEQALVAPPPPPAEVEAPHELTLIRKALTSLRDRDAAHALTLLDEHASRFPTGSFATERRGLRVVALCAAGRIDEGRRERAAFLKHAGASPIAARVRGACGEREE